MPGGNSSAKAPRINDYCFFFAFKAYHAYFLYESSTLYNPDSGLIWPKIKMNPVRVIIITIYTYIYIDIFRLFSDYFLGVAKHAFFVENYIVEGFRASRYDFCYKHELSANVMCTSDIPVQGKQNRKMIGSTLSA